MGLRNARAQSGWVASLSGRGLVRDVRLPVEDRVEGSRALSRFGRNLRSAREAAGLSQEHLALLCNLRSEAVYRMERGLVDPKLMVLVVLAHELGVSIEQLAGGPRAAAASAKHGEPG